MIALAARRILRPDATLRPGTVMVDGDRIAAVLDDPGADPPDVTLAPGLVDLQVNGLGEFDVAAGDLSALGLALRDAGTTSWCPTLTSRPLGAYADWFAALPARVRLVTLAPELAGALGAIAVLRAAGVVVALGHSDATYDEARSAADAGASLVTHVFNAMAPLHHRAPGLAGAALSDPRLTPTVIGDGVHVHPAVLALILRTGRAVLVSDAVASAGFALDSGAARRADGTLAGSVITLADAVAVAVGAGVPLATALTAASTHPADAIGRPDLGRLVTGARADVIALDPALRVVRSWVAGR